mgnify:CR=1 FL=1
MKPKPLKLRSYSYYKCNCGDYEEGCINCLLNDVNRGDDETYLTQLEMYNEWLFKLAFKDIFG